MRSMKKKHRSHLKYIWSYPNIHSLIGGWKNKKKFENVHTYLMFIGYPRSGHSLIGSLLDAHPDMVIANQLDALSLFEHNYSREQIYFLIWENAQKEGLAGRSNSGYDYIVPNQWQGKSRQIKVIGDKRGGKSSRVLAKGEKMYLLTKIPKVTNAKLKMIHVIRNPYDNISTMISRSMKRAGRVFNDELFEQKINSYFDKIAINAHLLKQGELDIFNIHLEDFIRHPKQLLKEMCQFLGLEANNGYLNDCASILWPEPNESRFKTNIWATERIQAVAQKQQQYDFLRRYTFEN